MKLVIAIILAFCLDSDFAYGQIAFRAYSTEVQDSFDVYVTIGNVDSTKPIHYFYYLDAGIKSGKELRRQVATLPKLLLKNKVFVGIGHIGDFHKKRRRDFIPPSDQIKEGHADRFYTFLTKNFIPTIEAKYGQPANRSIIGHSFGGLFVFYSLLREGRMFDRFFALSPSLWTNHYAIFNQEKSFYEASKDLPVFLYLSAGTGEKLNYILTGNRRMKERLNQRQYQSLRFAYEEHLGKTHNSQVPKSMAALLTLPD